MTETRLNVKVELPFSQQKELVTVEFNPEAGKNNQPIYRSIAGSRLKIAIWKDDGRRNKGTD